tara:strand:+ start:521 stop:712 length:192 start_codon:yes stop_codon:yes gene_type:complete
VGIVDASDFRSTVDLYSIERSSGFLTGYLQCVAKGGVGGESGLAGLGGLAGFAQAGQGLLVLG